MSAQSNSKENFPDLGRLAEDSTDDRLTIIVPAFSQIAFEVHRQNMWERGYRLESKINAHKYFESDGTHVKKLFEGRTMYAATFVKR